jgi:Ribonuclease G/E
VTDPDREPGDTGTDTPGTTDDAPEGEDRTARNRTRRRGSRGGRGRGARGRAAARDAAADDTSSTAAPAEASGDASAPPADEPSEAPGATADTTDTQAAADADAADADAADAADADAADAADAADTDTAAADTEDTGERADGDGREDTGEGQGAGRRRRRRGRRGRGRGKGGRSGDDAPDGDDTTSGGSGGDPGPADADDGDEDRAGRERGAGSRGGARAGQQRGERTRSTARAGDGSDGDSAVEEAIAKGGTRMAAKSARRGNGGGNGQRRGNQRPGGVPEEVRRAILEGPPRTMLVTAREDRTQIAVLEDRTVVEHYVTRKEDVTFVGNIYMARVQNVLPGMEAAFLDIGKGRNGVLYAGEVLYDELDLEEGEDQRIENVLKAGKKVLVQVTKDPMGSKGPRLTMHLSLAGRYMVLAPNSDLFGISRKLTDKERDRLRRIVKKVKPDHHGVIVRTAAEGATEEQITADIERLLAKWDKVETAAAEAKALTAVYEEPPLVVKVIRDNFGPEFLRCIVDDEELYHQVRGYLEEVAPELLDKVELYGAPTADARARAAGAPPLASAGTPGGNGASVRDPATDAAADQASSQAAGTEGAPDAPATEPDAAVDPPAATTGGPDDAPATTPPPPDGSEETDAATAPQGEVDLAAAAERRKSLPGLFEAYDVADQLRKAMGRKVWLPSGGYLIIESTEAMKVIDVNTGKFTGGKDTNLEEVVLKTNLEAADEIVRQLRLRDMGGIIIIDFIDMLLKANQDQVVRRLKRELLRDRTKTRVSEVSKLGLVQMTRKNVSQGLVESFSHSCEHCEGRGSISELD